MSEFQEALERIVAGPERKSRIISDAEKAIIAYHEGGHAVVQRILPKCDPVAKVTIISRGMALGYTMALPTEDRYLQSKTEFEDKIAGLLGGNVAERLIFGDTTTGASNDIEKATDLARRMVTEFGMSDKLGPLSFGKRDELVFLGREIGEQRNYSDEVAKTIDEEVRAIIDKAYERATEVLTTHRDKLDRPRREARRRGDRRLRRLRGALQRRAAEGGSPRHPDDHRPRPAGAGTEPAAGLTAGATDSARRATSEPATARSFGFCARHRQRRLAGGRPGPRSALHRGAREGRSTLPQAPSQVPPAGRRTARRASSADSVGATVGGWSPSAVSRFRQTAANTPMTGTARNIPRTPASSPPAGMASRTIAGWMLTARPYTKRRDEAALDDVHHDRVDAHDDDVLLVPYFTATKNASRLVAAWPMYGMKPPRNDRTAIGSASGSPEQHHDRPSR